MIPYLELPTFEPIHGLPLSVFGLTAFLAVVVGVEMTLRRAEACGVPRDRMNALLNWILGFGFVGAHLVAVLIYHPERVRADPNVVWQVWKGIASSGGIGAGAIAAYAFARRFRIDRLAVLDALAYGIAPAWIFGRMGCTLVHDHPGALTHFPLAVAYPDAGNELHAVGPAWLHMKIAHGQSGMGRFDLGMSEIPLAILLTLLMRWLAKKPLRHGTLTAVFLGLYAPTRFGLDFLRATDVAEPDPRFLGLTFAQYLALAVTAGCAWWLVTRRPLAIADRPPAWTEEPATPRAVPARSRKR